MSNVINTSVGFKGRLRVQTKNVETGEWMQDSGWFHNLITDTLFNKICSNSNNLNQNYGATAYLTHCALGTGTTPPSATDTVLSAPHGSRTASVDVNVQANAGTPNYYAYLTKRFVFPQGGIVGNMTEVGIFHGDSGNNCCVHALLKDGAGNPTTMTVTSIEQVYITYELRQYPTLTDSPGTITISGITYDYVLRSFNVQGSWGCIWSIGLFGYSGWPIFAGGSNVPLALTTTPGYGNLPSTYTITPYVTGTYYSEMEVVWGTADGNIAGGVGAIFVTTHQNSVTQGEGYGFYFTPKLDKTNVKQLTLKFRIGLVRL